MMFASIAEIHLFAGYIEKLMSKTITFCEDQECTVTEITPQPLCAAYEHPPKSRTIQEHKSRFSTTK